MSNGDLEKPDAKELTHDEARFKLRVYILYRILQLLPPSWYIDHYGDITPFFSKMLGIRIPPEIDESKLPDDLLDKNAQLNPKYLNPY